MATAPHRSHLWRKLIIIIVALIVASIAFAAWYKQQYSMGVAQTHDVAGAPDAPRVLIATQASAYKDAVTAGLVEHLKARSATVRVIDVGALADVKAADWNAIVLLHTWEMGKPPAAVRAFVDRVPDRSRLVALATSGQGSFRIPGIDAISSASKMVDVPAQVQALAQRVDALLD